MDDQARRSEKLQEFADDFGEDLLAGEKRFGQPMYRDGVRRHIAFRVDVGVERPSGRQMMDQFEASDLNDAVAG